jgi:plastocyanin
MNEYKFSPNHLDIKAGKVVFYLVNAGTLSHDLVIVDAGVKRIGKSELVQAGNAATFTLQDLAAGTYKIYCDVTGHRDQGMEGTIEVT